MACPEDVANAPVAASRDVAWAQTLLEATFDGVLVVDGAGSIQFANRQVEVPFGREWRELIGQTVDLLFPPSFRQVHLEGVGPRPGGRSGRSSRAPGASLGSPQGRRRPDRGGQPEPVQHGRRRPGRLPDHGHQRPDRGREAVRPCSEPSPCPPMCGSARRTVSS